MNCTAEEAKKLWCQLARAACQEKASDGTVLRNYTGNGGATCKSDACMMWVWHYNPKLVTYTYGPPLNQSVDVAEAELAYWTPPPPLGPGTGWTLQDKNIDEEDSRYIARWTRETDPDRTGNCGLVRSINP